MADDPKITKDDDGNEFVLEPVSDWVDWYGEESGIPALDTLEGEEPETAPA